jgi:hypothetical protein
MIDNLLLQTEAAAELALDRLVPMSSLVPEIPQMTPHAETMFWQKLGAPVTFTKSLPMDIRQGIGRHLATDDMVLARWWGEDLRAMVSGDYTCLPHHLVAQAIRDRGDMVVRNFWPRTVDARTTTLHIRCTLPGREYQIQPGDNAHLLLHIANSEVGTSGLRCHLGLYRLVCSNGLFVFRQLATLLSVRHIYHTPQEMLSILTGALEGAEEQVSILREKLGEAREIQVSREAALARLEGMMLPRYIIEDAMSSMAGLTLFDFFMALTYATRLYPNFSARVAVERRASDMLYDTTWVDGVEVQTPVCPECGRPHPGGH